MKNSQPVQYAYVDESGDPYLDLTKEGSSKYYVVTAILVDGTHKKQLVADIDQIRSQFFGDGEMKSSGVGGSVDRRRDILLKLVNAGVKFYSFVADKSQIDQASGLQYKKSFIKYLHGRLYKRLYRTFTSLHVLADEHGRTEFMESFKSYLQSKYQKELFDHEDFTFVSSEKHPLVQAADIIGGTLLRVYSGKDDAKLLDLLSESAIIIERWPPSNEYTDVLTGLDQDERFNHLVAQQSIMLAREFIRDNLNSDNQDTESQVETLRYLLYRYELNPSLYIHAQRILDHVNSYRAEKASIQSFRMMVIARLRSRGVIIASSNKGYKIPNTTTDIGDFVSLVQGQVLPYLRRLDKAREHLLLASQGEYDIVKAEQYPQLLRCLASLQKDVREQ